MIKINPAELFSKLKVSKYIHSQVIRWVLILVILLILPTISSMRLSYSQPGVFESGVAEIIKPSPGLVGIEDQNFLQASIKAQEAIFEVKDEFIEVPREHKSYAQLCEGISEDWKLIPNPDKEGQFIICNSENSGSAECCSE